MSAESNLKARRELVPVFRDIALAAQRNILLPKNAKKHHWGDMSRLELYEKAAGELWECLEAETEGEMVREAGDVMVYLAFAVDQRRGRPE